jgi:butyryl-CoA dehydrogenase
MASRYLDSETLKFLLYNVHHLEEVLQQERFKDYDRESVGLFIDAVTDFSEKELFPYYQEMDAHPAHFEAGEVHVHPQVARYLKRAKEMGLAAALFDYEDGGLQMPNLVVTAAAYIQETANNHLPGYLGLTFGAAELILHFGSRQLKDTYVPHMISGDWNGTMCLTEPQAGSSLSDIVTSAKPQGDHYLISGQKIFISGGDYKGVDNVVHLLLARIEGAPAGTKGISLFVVPKHRPAADGSLAFNDVNTVGDFQKMGQRGYCTTHLSFGDHHDCRGWLVGEPHQGLKYMFLMMNGARIAVGRGAAAIAMAGWRASLAYAKERPQGRALSSTGKKDVSEAQTLIINHPDVRRMLLTQKVIAEGALSLVLLSSKYQDLSQTHPDEAERRKYGYLLELLTPVAKTYPSEKGIEAVSNGVQVLGGYGFCSDFILQQYYRDIRIFSIYEGTTGIQSMDLLGRKVTMDQGIALTHLAGEMGKTIAAAMAMEGLKPFAETLAGKTGLMKKVLDSLLRYAGKGNYERFLADATVFMEFFGNILVGWLWLDMALHARQAISRGDTTHGQGFYKSKIHAMEFYFTYELPKSEAQAQVLLNTADLTVSVEESLFE